jgi:hypothetical protein
MPETVKKSALQVTRERQAVALLAASPIVGTVDECKDRVAAIEKATGMTLKQIRALRDEYKDDLLLG